MLQQGNSRRASSFPIPIPAPVTTAILPWSSIPPTQPTTVASLQILSLATSPAVSLDRRTPQTPQDSEAEQTCACDLLQEMIMTKSQWVWVNQQRPMSKCNMQQRLK